MLILVILHEILVLVRQQKSKVGGSLAFEYAAIFWHAALLEERLAVHHLYRRTTLSD